MLITVTWTPDRAGRDGPDGRASADIDRVYLHVDAVHDHHAAKLHQMERHGEQWTSTLDLPDDLVSSYRIMPVHRELAEWIDSAQGDAADSRSRWRALSEVAVPHVLDQPVWRPGLFAGTSGRLVLPGAPEQAGWEQRDTPLEDLGAAGDLWELGELGGRRIWTAGLQRRMGSETTPRHLLVLSDGLNWASTALPAALERLKESGRLPRFGVVVVDTAEDRYELLTRSRHYRDLIADQIIPWAWSRLGYSPDASRTVVSGESLGGLAALDLVLTRPDAATRALCTSGSFWFTRSGGTNGGSTGHAGDRRNVGDAGNSGSAGGEIAAEIRAGGGVIAPGLRVHLSVGTGEGIPGGAGVSRWTMVDHTMAVHDALREAGVPTTVEVGTHGHELAGWAGALTRGLIRLV